VSLRSRALAVALVLCSLCCTAQIVELDHMQVLSAAGPAPPAFGAPWQSVRLPDGPFANLAEPAAGPRWYRSNFEWREEDAMRGSWAVYLAYLYGGGEVWINGSFAGAVGEGTTALIVRWERPHLLPVPANMLRTGSNQLDIRVPNGAAGAARHFPRVAIGPVQLLQPRHDTRMFWVRTMPQITVVVCLVASMFVLFIWWCRRSEVLYGLFGLASALWGLRTLTFVIEQVPADQWVSWRIAYLAATGGFIVVMAIFSMRLVGIRKPWVERALVAYWSIGPTLLAILGVEGEALVNRFWIGGMVPIGVAILLLAGWSVWQQRSLSTALLPTAIAVAVMAGVHDYMMAWNVGFLATLLPGWSGQRIFLLHHAANLLLLAMAGLLTARFVQALRALEDLNKTLEARVADRERNLAASFERMAVLQQQNAASQERQLIMREIHDGLGSRLFTSLLRVERGDMGPSQIAESLRACIADMRLALDALTPDEPDFRTVLGDFLFRWQVQLEEAHVRASWSIDVPDSALTVAPQTALQLLRIAQEALTNVLKHARAQHVDVRLRHAGGMLELEVADDGRGGVEPAGANGRGMHNMRSRARQLGGILELQSNAQGTRVLLQVPVSALGG
jgi:signal transduction histidine kinase